MIFSFKESTQSSSEQFEQLASKMNSSAKASGGEEWEGKGGRREGWKK